MPPSRSGRARVGEVELEYETFGDPTRPSVLLVSGLGSQLLGWNEGLCGEIASRGFHVIRFDNRDVGLSTQMPPAAAYTLHEMAGDAAGLLAALGIPAAHIVGASMGGMIAQLVAIEHPARTLSLTIVMSDLGAGDSVLAEREVLDRLLLPAAANREERIEQSVATTRITWGPSFDAARSRIRSAAAVDRAFFPEGVVRQFLAIMATGSRREGLGRVKVPVLVIHGDGDPLIPFANAALLVDAAPGAELLVMDETGHDLPPSQWPKIADGIAALAAKLEPGVGVAER